MQYLLTEEEYNRLKKEDLVVKLKSDFKAYFKEQSNLNLENKILPYYKALLFDHHSSPILRGYMEAIKEYDKDIEKVIEAWEPSCF